MTYMYGCVQWFGANPLLEHDDDVFVSTRVNNIIKNDTAA